MDIKTTVLDALDDLSSTRSSLSRRSRALDSLEKLLASLCTASDKTQLDGFLELQNGFEGNVASRILTSIAICMPALQQLLSTSTDQDSKAAAEMRTLNQHTQQTLSIIQGVALIHPESKAFLGRKSSIHILLDILSIARHASSSISGGRSTPDSNAGSSKSSESAAPSVPNLAASVLDTLLCILVDSPSALRIFEEASGVEAVVKTLKKANVAREVRMKCLEFLYFYLLPEDGSSPANNRSTSDPAKGRASDSFAQTALASPSKSVPGSPVHWGYQIPQTPAAPHTPRLIGHSRTGSSDSRGGKSPEPNGPKTPTKRDFFPQSSNPSPEAPARSKKAVLQMLQDEIDYVPVSPKKDQVAQLGVGTPKQSRVLSKDGGVSKRLNGSEANTPTKTIFPSFSPGTPAKKKSAVPKPIEVKRIAERRRSKEHSHSRSQDEGRMTPGQLTKLRPLSPTKSEIITRSESGTALEEMTNISSLFPPMSPTKSPPKMSQLPGGPRRPGAQSPVQQPRIRSTEEKKELLGTWLGNVDALVEGVQKAGVWGLA